MPQILKENVAGAQKAPSPELFFNTANAYQRSAALKGAVDLDLFTAIGEGKTTAKDIAERVRASERGVRILCDYLVVAGFLTKDGGRYGNTPDSAVFLDKKSPAYVGGALGFLNSAGIMAAFSDVAATVRHGGTLIGESGTVSDENSIWIDFAKSMKPLMANTAQGLARIVLEGSTKPMKVLDVAGGHGIFGIAFAQQNPNATVVLQDWAPVGAVARENARAAGVADRHRVLPGSAFDVDFGADYDVVLLTNFLHHFDKATNEKLLKKAHKALKADGRCVTVDFIPNEDRVSPPTAAAFSLVMLASTPAGDAYTFREYQDLFRAAGFTRNDLHNLPPSPNQAIVSYK